MTVKEAVELVISALETNFIGFIPYVKVMEYSGTFSVEEVKRLYTSTPALLVSPLEDDKDGVKTVVYLLAKSTDKRLLDMIDYTTSALRYLPPESSPLLQVASKSLYDKDAGKLGARLWAFVTTVPKKLGSESSGLTGGVLRKELTGMAGNFEDAIPDVTIAYTDRDVSVLEAEGIPPFILIKKDKGVFTSLKGGVTKYANDKNVMMQRSVTGTLEQSLNIEIWARDDGEAEELAFKILPLLPVNTIEEGLQRVIKITEATSEDDVAGASIYKVGVSLKRQVGSDPVVLPVFKTSNAN